MNIAKNRKIEWSKESVLLLIQVWEEFECLYNPHSEFYYNKNARNNALDIIANKLKRKIPNITSTEIKTKINYLRTQYCRELSKIKVSSKSSSEYEHIYNPTAYWFDRLGFLMGHINIRTGISSFPEVVDVGGITSEDSELVPTVSAKRKKKKEAGNIALEDELLLQAKELLEKLAHPSFDTYNEALLRFLEENIREVKDQILRDELTEKIIAIVLEYKRKQLRLDIAK